MLHKLIIRNGIKHKNSEFTFEKGLTVIKGKNGNGKSLIQEFIRFALFGSSALRGKVSDYPADMEVGLSLWIKGKKVSIDRTLKDCTVRSEGGDITRGTTACNTWIIKELGYDLSVFDMGNAAKQFEINKLGKMKPSERKTAIDQVIGLSAVTKLIKQLKDERNELKSFISGIESVLTKPEEPTKPENYKESKEFKKEIDEKIQLRLDYESLLKTAEFSKIAEPIWVGDVPSGDLSKEYHHKQLLTFRDEYLKEGVEGSQYTEDELWEWLSASDQWQDYIEPELSIEEISKHKEQWEKYKKYINMQKITCPKCKHVFSLEGEIEEVEKPKFSEEYLNEQRMRHYNHPKFRRPETFITKRFVDEEKNKMKRKYSYDKICEELSELGDVDYERLRAYKQYESDLEKWNNYQKILDKIRDFPVDKIVNKEITDKLELDYFTFKQYESDVERYKQDKEKYESLIKTVEDKKVRMEDCNKGITGLTNFMSCVKNSIIPSLSRVATNLVREMTDNQISEIKIEEDFSITADGKEICLLSGGEEAVVNLAIRLALSSVLTRKVLSLFIGDEIDQSMDEERAKNTADMLIRLSKSQIEQIILITHKDIEGDNLIDI